VPTYRHKKTGGEYLLITDSCVKLEEKWNDGVMYRSSEGVTIIRDKDEFNDGRFEKVEKESGEAS
jgi:hypothetical protein